MNILVDLKGRGVNPIPIFPIFIFSLCFLIMFRMLIYAPYRGRIINNRILLFIILFLLCWEGVFWGWKSGAFWSIKIVSFLCPYCVSSWLIYYAYMIYLFLAVYFVYNALKKQ